ncbi:hypothetical protein [Candidatus Phytoplasma asteris]|uniref:hypothetical protein n=1 Tax=Candidatus Phytoplasma asteris TaxID=85620 RepID=UPI0039DFD551
MLPDLKARKAILKLCAKGKQIADEDINLEQLAQETQGLSGAQLKAILNEASMLQAEKNK